MSQCIEFRLSSQYQFSVLFDQQFLVKYRIVQVQQHPFLPDLAPCKSFMFPKQKIHLNGKKFNRSHMIMHLFTT